MTIGARRAAGLSSVLTPALAPALALAGLALFALLLAAVLPSVALATQCLIFVIATLGSTFLLGRVGLASFGQAIPFGVASYASALGMKLLGLHALTAILFALAIATAVSALVGVIAVQRRGIYFFMLTLALGEMVYFIAYASSDLTGGDNGLVDVPRPPLDLAGLDVIGIAQPWRFYLLVVVCCLVSYALLDRVCRSPFGAVLVAIRENENRAVAVGFDTRFYKFAAFTLSSAVTGLAGALYALYLKFVPLGNVDLATSRDILVMTILGGTESLFGGVLGGAVYILLAHFLSAVWNRWPFIVGCLLLAVALGFRGGLWAVVQAAVRTLPRPLRPAGGR
jgi:branched-chain amino acid transport system permease protein